MDLVFGFLAGVLTLLNPCVLPVLPVVLITALNQHRLGPLTLCAGLSVTFVVVGLTIASLGPAWKSRVRSIANPVEQNESDRGDCDSQPRPTRNSFCKQSGGDERRQQQTT